MPKNFYVKNLVLLEVKLQNNKSVEIKLLSPRVLYLFLEVAGFQDISASKFHIILFTFHPRYTCAPLKPLVCIVLTEKLLASYRNRNVLRYATLHWSHHSSFLCLISPCHILTDNSKVEICNGYKSNMDITDENNFKSCKFWTLKRTYTTDIIDILKCKS